MASHTWATGDVLTASDMNNYVRDLIQQPACAARSSGTQAIATATQTALAFDSTEDYDTDGVHSLVTNTSRFTPTVSGLYVMTATVQTYSSATGTYRQSGICKNGSYGTNYAFMRIPPNTVSPYLCLTSVPVAMNGTTDYLEVTFQHDNGVNTTPGVSIASIMRVRS